MTRVTFYTHVAQPLALVTWLLQRKIYAQKLTACVVGDEETLRHLDNVLWENDFLPHAFLGTTVAPDTPIILTAEEPPPTYTADVLISLQANVPPFFSRFGRYVDIVSKRDIQPGRQRYRYLKDHGYAIDIYPINK